jgi:type I restriction enzyme S subunit
MNGDLPQGWALVTLRDLTSNPKQDIISGPFGSNLKAEEYVSKGVPIIRLQNVDSGRFLEKNMRFITPQKARELSAHTFQSGDIVITKLGDPLGKACIVPDSLPSGIVVADVVRVRIDESRFLKNYVVFAVNSPSVMNQINSEMKGSTRPRVNLNQIRDLQIPLAPIAEQRRISAKLESLLGQVDACQQRLDKIPTLLKRFRQAVLAAACSGGLTEDWREKSQHSIALSPIEKLRETGLRRLQAFQLELTAAARRGTRRPRRPTNLEPQLRDNPAADELPEGWFWISFEDAASTISYAMSSGPFGSALGRKDYRATGVPVIRGQNIQAGKFVAENFVFISPEKANELARSSTKPGDIVVVAVGSSGQSAIIPKTIQFAILSQNCNKITVDSELVLPEFVNFVLQVEIAGEQLRERTTDTARPFLSLTNLKTLLLPVPPLPEQQEIVRRVESLFALADTIKQRYKNAQAFVDKLTPSLLAKAFRGELVPQDPNDEPASVLLERIKAEKKPTQSKGKRYKR